LKSTHALPCCAGKRSELSNMGAGVKILKSDLIYLPAFEHCHNKTSALHFEKQGLLHFLATAPFLPPGFLSPSVQSPPATPQHQLL
jgi:hypothetical protein